MEFVVNDQRIHIQGDPHLADFEISMSGLRRPVAREEVAYFCHLWCEEPPEAPTPIWPELFGVLEEFRDMLEESRVLPRTGPTDHRITLAEGVQPVKVNPYRYPHYQKNEIERLTSEMLQQSLIRRSISPFSSLVLLVRKKDGSWCFCVDYRFLNSVTVND